MKDMILNKASRLTGKEYDVFFSDQYCGECKTKIEITVEVLRSV